MSILQISKIQQRSGNIVDLPQLDEAEFGWATDTKQLFIGKTTPNENVEVLTSYSTINFDQINGAVGNLNITESTLAAGQLLSYDGNSWVNRGGNAGGILDLGEVSNVKISGGAIGYVLETDGLGNLSWTPKSTIVSFIQNVSHADPAVVTTVQENFLTDGQKITVTNAQGMTELNGNSYFVDILTSNSFALYANADLTGSIDSSSFTEYAFTDATATTASTNIITIDDSDLFALNQEIQFLGDLGNSALENNTSYYIKTIPNTTSITISEELLSNGVAGDTKALSTETLTSVNLFGVGGRAISSTGTGSGGNAAPGGGNGSVQYNRSNLLDGDASFVWNSDNTTLTVAGNINVENVNISSVSTATRFISNVATGTSPLSVSSTTRVANLNVDRANVSDNGSVTSRNTGTFFPVFVSNSSSSNYALGSNSSLSFNAATGELSATSFSGNISTPNQPNITSVGTLTELIVDGNITAESIISNASMSGDASGLFEINAGNLSSGTIPTARLSGIYDISVTTANTAGTVTSNSQPNITSLGTLASLSVTNKIIAGQLEGDGGNISNIQGSNVLGEVSFAEVANSVVGGNVTGQVSNALVSGTVYTNAQPNITSVGTLSELTVSGNLNTTQLTTGANTTGGSITGNWTLTNGSRMQATYADLAEYYEADSEYEPGTVLMFGGNKEVTIAEDGTNKVAGVVSTNPAYVMNSTCPGLLTAVALQGRVPCKVRGKIAKGDMLISGGNGFARPNQFPTIGTVIGKALEDFDGYEGIIEVAVGRL